MRRCEEAYRRISEESHSRHPFFPPSVCRLLQTQRWRNEASCCLHSFQEAEDLLRRVNPNPPSNTSFLSSFSLSCHTQLEQTRTHTHTQTYTLPHTLTHVSPILQPHTSSRTVTTRNERLKPRQPDSVLTLLAPPLPAEGGGERGRQRGEGEKERGVTHDLHSYT